MWPPVPPSPIRGERTLAGASLPSLVTVKWHLTEKEGKRTDMIDRLMVISFRVRKRNPGGEQIMEEWNLPAVLSVFCPILSTLEGLLHFISGTAPSDFSDVVIVVVLVGTVVGRAALEVGVSGTGTCTGGEEIPIGRFQGQLMKGAGFNVVPEKRRSFSTLRRFKGGSLFTSP